MGWFRRLRTTIVPSSIDDESAEEMRGHLEQRVEDYVALGMTPDEARRQAVRRLGNLTLSREQTRDADTLGWLDDLLQDLRYAARLLRRIPVFSLTVAVSRPTGLRATTPV